MPDFLTDFSDSSVYFFMGAVGSALFLIRIALMLVFGVDGGGDFEVDIDVNTGIEAHGGDFTLFSMLSIMSFVMGAGWMGVACRVEWGIGPIAAGAAAASFGLFLMLLSSTGMWQMQKMNQAGGYNVRHCIGKVGRVYLKIPAKGQGRGQVQITVDGRQKVLAAVSSGEEIESFAAVKVLDVQEQETIVVERAQ